MLNILRKKLVNKIFLLLLIFLYFPVVSANIDIKQGDNINFDYLPSVYIGMNKNEVLKLFGSPVLLPNCEDDCFCYYYYYLPINSAKRIKYSYILMFFDNSLLVSYVLKK